MKKNLLLIFTLLSCLLIVLWPGDPLLSHGNGAPAGYTGSPNEFGGRTCTSCHAGGASSPAPGALTSDIPACGYTPGVTYNLTLTFGLAGRTKFGFQLSPQRSGGITGGTLVEATNELQLQNSARYITHTSSGTAAPVGTNTRTWNFQWIAPAAGSGTVTFYYALNATNSNNQNSGDLIFNSNIAFQEAVPLSISTSGSTNLCTGQTISLTSSLGSGNAWASETGTAVGNTATITTNPSFTTYILTNTNGSCIQNDTVELNIIPAPEIPVITVGPDGTEFCAGFSTTLTVENVGGITWAATGETGSEIIVDSAGFYIATATNNCGSSESEPVEIIVNPLPEIPVITADGPLEFCFGDSVVLSTNATGGVAWEPMVSGEQSITVTEEGEYTVSVFNECGLVTSEGTFVDVKEVPDAPEVTVNAPEGFCDGALVTLEVTNAASDTITWLPGDSHEVILNIPLSGIYSAVLTNSCGVSEATETIVGFTPVPETSVIFLNDQAELESSVTGDSYIWTKNGAVIDGIITQTILPQGEGIYTVTVLTADNCAGLPSAAFNFTTIGISDLNADAWSVFPNPSQGNITILLPSGNTIEQFNITDLSGRLIKTVPAIGTAVISLNLNLKPGIYSIDGGGKFKKMLVIK